MFSIRNFDSKNEHGRIEFLLPTITEPSLPNAYSNNYKIFWLLKNHFNPKVILLF